MIFIFFIIFVIFTLKSEVDEDSVSSFYFVSNESEEVSNQEEAEEYNSPEDIKIDTEPKTDNIPDITALADDAINAYLRGSK